MKVLNNKVVNTPEGLIVINDRRGIVYRVRDKSVIIRLVAEVLFRLSRDAKGSVVYLNNRKIVALLGLELSGHFDALTSSWVSLLLSELGIVTQSFTMRKRNYIVIDMKNPLVEKIKAAKSVDEVVEIIKSRLR